MILKLMAASTDCTLFLDEIGNITKAAKELGLTRTALYRKLSKHDI